jgi:hypothetical protein
VPGGVPHVRRRLSSSPFALNGAGGSRGCPPAPGVRCHEGRSLEGLAGRPSRRGQASPAQKRTKGPGRAREPMRAWSAWELRSAPDPSRTRHEWPRK